MRKKLTWLVPLVCISAVVFVFITSAGYDEKIAQEKPIVPHQYSIRLLLDGITNEHLLEQFPYGRYLDSANIQDIQSIKNDLAVLNEKFPGDSMRNMQLISIALTDSLYAQYEKKHYFQIFDADFLTQLFQWAEKFNAYAEIEQSNTLLYGSIYNYWGSKISNHLGELSKNNSSLKYEYKFKYLKSKCDEKRFSVATKVGQVEKVAYNLLSSQWSHLLNASWNQATYMQLVVFFVFGILTIYGYLLIIKKIIKRNENQ
ncbi:hypothetical protein OCK74_19965 [Chitinophagaceae bacterium LB-8]|uniref:Uncharacterized protein n=1 Tax=Paraflavisolibacter caeni TaxID=2982496 RepID=A0A9X3BGS2_9BACT|nr:hypothetical protein [Paraflavisolibacter caeni]MCU7551409.1 hypothetical protein [Paraflavisolibacter caeni]